MVRPIPSTIASDSEDETVRNIEIAFQSLNLRSPGSESQQLESDIRNSDIEARAVTPENSNDVSQNDHDKQEDENETSEEEEEGAVGFDLSSTIELNDTQTDDVFDSSVPFSEISKDFSNVTFDTPSPRFRSRSTTLQDSIVSSSSTSTRKRRHSAGETFDNKDCSTSPSSQCKAGSPRNSQGDHVNNHACCSPRSIRVEDSEMLNEGATIYREFLREEFRRRNIQEPPCLNSNPYPRMRANSMADVVRASNQLCFMSDQFARSPMRQWVQEQADSVSLQYLDFNSFSDLLYGLFQEGGVTWERVLVLFFFCADVSIRAFREKLQGQFHDIISWSLQFISGKQFTQWIQDNGGWARVLQSSVDQAYKLAIIGFCTFGMLAFAAYLWKNK